MECRAWTEVLKEVTESINIKYANRSYICRYYQDIYNELKKGRGREQLMDAFDGPGMLFDRSACAVHGKRGNRTWQGN